MRFLFICGFFCFECEGYYILLGILCIFFQFLITIFNFMFSITFRFDDFNLI